MTGRAAGYCAGYPVPGFMNPVGGRGFGGGWGRGRGGHGRRNWFYATGLTARQRAAGWPAYGPGVTPAEPYGAVAAPTRAQQVEALKAQAEYFADALEGIRKRITELESQSQETE